MFLDKYKRRLKRYETESKNKINKSRTSTIYSVLFLSLILIICLIGYVIIKNPLWFRLLKVKLKS